MNRRKKAVKRFTYLFSISSLTVLLKWTTDLSREINKILELIWTMFNNISRDEHGSARFFK